MTTAAPTSVATHLASAHGAASSSSFARQVGVEARKLVDTRAGFWLLVSGGLLTVVVAVVNNLVALEAVKQGGTGIITWMFSTGSVGGALGVFLGLLAVLTVTSEWSQRTALTTFALEPRRGRVLATKAVVLAGATALLVAVAVAVGAASVAVTRMTGATATWDLPAAELGGFIALAFLNTATGMAFGLLFLNSAAGIVSFFALPTLGSVIAAIGVVWEPLGRVADWIVPTASTSALQAGAIHGVEWWQLLTSHLVWVVLPAAVGTWRWLRRQVV